MRMATAAFDLEVLGGGGDDAGRFVSSYKGQVASGLARSRWARDERVHVHGLDVLGRERTVLDVQNAGCISRRGRAGGSTPGP